MARFGKRNSAELLAAVKNLKKSGFKLKKDYRLPEHRLELFKRYFNWRVRTYDLDHTHYMKYMTKDYDFERKAWFSVLFGMTYRTPQAFAYAETFPYIQDYSLQHLEDWHAENWKRTTYGTDARYNKGHFFNQTKTVLEWLDGKSFETRFKEIGVLDGTSSLENFNILYEETDHWYKFGRMTGWLVLQALHDLLELKIDPNDILLQGYKPDNDSSLGSIWNGLCALRNEPEKMVGKYGDYKSNEEDIEIGRNYLNDYTAEAEDYSGLKIDSFRKESIWCQYKRLFNTEGSFEYPGHASGDAVSRYLYYREAWPEIDWSSFRQAIRDQPGLVKGQTFQGWHNGIFGATGLLLNMHEMYYDIPNAYELLGIDPNELLVKEVWEDDDLKVPKIYTGFSPFPSDKITAPEYWKTTV